MAKLTSSNCVPKALINTEDALDALVLRMRDSQRIGLDTEFVQGIVYKPALALIQVALEDGTIHLIDPVNLTNLHLLGDIWADSRIIKILHDPLQDLNFLRAAAGASFKNVFDTRLAGQLLSVGENASLSAYVEWLTGEAVDKGPRQSNWLLRPLSRSQMFYACNDVVYLLRMHTRMVKLARDMGRSQWIVEDMEQYDDPATYDLGGDPVLRVFKQDAVRALRPRNRAIMVAT